MSTNMPTFGPVVLEIALDIFIKIFIQDGKNDQVNKYQVFLR